MRIRKGYKRHALSTKSVKLKLVGGDIDYTACCAGYYAGKTSLIPSRKFAVYNPYATLKNIENINYFDDIGLPIAVITSGQVYKVNPVYLVSPFEYTGLTGTYLHSVFPCYHEDKPAVAVVSGPRITFITGEKYVNKQIAFQLKGACIHAGRIFAADAKDGYSVRWSGTDYLDWKQSAYGSGYIKLPPDRGRIYAVVSFGDRLIAMREKGLDILKAYGDPRYFSVVQHGGKTVTEKLREDTFVVCGNKLYFCSDSTVYCYDGDSISTVKMPDYMQADSFGNGKSCDGRYVFYYCRSKVLGGYYQLEIDVTKNTFSFFASEFQFIWKTDEGCFTWKDNTVYKESPDGQDMQSLWKSRDIDLGSGSVKTLKAIYAEMEEGACVTVYADGVARKISKGGKSYVGLTGRNFTFEVSGGAARSLEAEWEVRA